MSVAKKMRIVTPQIAPAAPRGIGKHYSATRTVVNGGGSFHYALRSAGASRDADQPKRLDRIDQAIVSQLQEDGRRPYRDMARELGVSEGTVRWRVRRLLESEVVRIAAIADPFRLGYRVLASILLRVAPGDLERVVDMLVSWPEVVYVSSCTGRVDIYIQVVCRDHEDLWELLATRIPAIGGVMDTETLMELKVHKLQYVYPAVPEESEPGG